MKKSMLLGILVLRIVLFYMTIVLCVFYLVTEKHVAWCIRHAPALCYMTIVLCVFYLSEERKAGYLVYWYFVL